MAEEKKAPETAHGAEAGAETAPAANSKLQGLMVDKKRLSALIAVIVIALAAVGGVVVWWKKTRAAAHGGDHKVVKAHAANGDEEEDDDHGHPPIFMPIERIVVKLHRGSKASVDHYLQVALDLKLADPKVNEKIKQYLPVIQHEVMLILSSKEFEWLDDVDHKKKLAIEIRDKINKIIKAETPSDGVKAVYFSSFILQ